jgi:hypothetical protein
MARRAELEAAEATAAHAAIECFMQTLRNELEKLHEATILGALGDTSHVHYTLVAGGVRGVIKFTVTFDASEAAAVTVLTSAAKRGDLGRRGG